jgi:hypothetical protein
MKATIAGYRYNTENGILVGKATSRGSRADPSYWEAELYKTPRGGKFFLAGGGGPMTRWAKPVGNMETGSESIIPLERDQALIWAKHYLPAKIVKTHFEDEG